MSKELKLNLPTLQRQFIGYDKLFDSIDRWANSAVSNTAGTGYPPYNIELVDENNYNIVIAVAGFDKNDVSVDVDNGTLIVEAYKAEEEDAEKTTYIHRGLAARAFKNTWKLNEYIEVKDAKMDNGLLNIKLERVLPESLKPRNVKIK